MTQPITFVGLGVHKATIAVSVVAAGRDGEVRLWGAWRTGPRWSAAWSNVFLRRGGRELRVCYEAGPCGYGLPDCGRLYDNFVARENPCD